MPTTGLPSTPPASLISLIARSNPANSGGPRNASEPVCGRIEPIVSMPSPARVPSTGTCGTSASAGAVSGRCTSSGRSSMRLLLAERQQAVAGLDRLAVAGERQRAGRRRRSRCRCRLSMSAAQSVNVVHFSPSRVMPLISGAIAMPSIACLQRASAEIIDGVVRLAGVVEVGEARIDLAQAADELRGDLAERCRAGEALEVAVGDIAGCVAAVGIAAGRSVGAGRRFGAGRFGAGRGLGASRCLGTGRSLGCRRCLGAGGCAAVGRAVVIAAAGCGGERQGDEQCTDAASRVVSA